MEDENKFWIVADLDNGTWQVCRAKKFESEADAIHYAKGLVARAGRYAGSSYTILEATKVVRPAHPPVEVVPCK